jgi:hypothetical protein
MRLDFTLTLPGLFEVERIQSLAQEFGVDVLAKVIFSFSPDIIFSPLALPRSILDRVIDNTVSRLPSGALRDVMIQLKTRPTFQEQWPDTWQTGLAQGKRRVLKLESIRTNPMVMDEILQQDQEVYEWWQNIR